MQSFFIVSVIGLLVATPTFAASTPSSVYVKVKATKLRSKPEYFANGIATLNYGDALQKIEGGDSWWKVKKGNSEGYIPVSAISDRKIVLTSSKAAQEQVNSGDVVLAGKGFSKEAEKQLAASDRKLNFAGVDRMESIRVSDQEVLAFINAGLLSKEG